MSPSTPVPSRHGNERFDAEAAAWDSNPDVHLASAAALTALVATHAALQPPLFAPTHPLPAHPGRRASLSAQPLAAFAASPHRPPLGAVSAPQANILEIGCGTGLLTLPLAAHAHLVLAVDASPGMIAALDAKLAADGAPRNVGTRCFLLVDPEDGRLPPAEPHSGKASGRLKFDLVVSHLMLHHIAEEDVAGLLRTMWGCLVPGVGEVCITDFEDVGEESRRFHPEAKMAGVMRHGIRRQWARDALESAVSVVLFILSFLAGVCQGRRWKRWTQR